MIGELRPCDRLAIVTYHEEARVLMPLTRAGGEESRARACARRCIVDLVAGGQTNLSDGLLRGIDQLLERYRPGGEGRERESEEQGGGGGGGARNSALLLMTDGEVNVGLTQNEPITARPAPPRATNGGNKDGTAHH